MFSFNRSEHFSADFCDIVNGDFHTIPHHYEALVFINFFHAAGYCDIDTAGLLLIGQVVCDGNFRLFVQRVLYCIQAFIDGALLSVILSDGSTSPISKGEVGMCAAKYFCTLVWL